MKSRQVPGNRRAWRSFILGFATVVVVVGAGYVVLDGDSTDARKEGVAIPQEPAPAGSGISIVSSVAPREGSAVTPVGVSSVFLYGGRQWTDSESDPTLFEDAYRVELDSGQTVALPSAQLGPLHEPAAASSGDDVLVIGLACSKIVRGEETYGCGDGKYRAALFHAAENTWESLKLPDEVLALYGSLAPEERRTTRRISGAGAPVAVFVVGDSRTQRVLEFDLQAKTWTLLPSLPKVATDYCASDESVAALVTSYDNLGKIVAEDPNHLPEDNVASIDDGYVLPSIYTFERGSNEWAVGPDNEQVKYSSAPRIGCMGLAVGVLGSSMVDLDFAIYDPTQRAWSDVIKPPASWGYGPVVWTGSELIVPPDELQVGLEVPVYNPGTGGFRIATDLPWSTTGASWNGAEIVGYTGPGSGLLWGPPLAGSDGVVEVPAGTFRFRP
jgi:hypothetical protein